MMTRQNPQKLRRLFAWLSVLAFGSILILSGLVIARIYTEEMNQIARETATSLARTLFEQEYSVLYDAATKPATVAIKADDMPAFDGRMRKHLKTLGMQKIKVIASDYQVIYATERQKVGQFDPDDEHVQTVFTEGQVVSQKSQDANGRWVMETYVPIHSVPDSPQSPVVGAFEVYVDVTGVHQRVQATLFSSLSWLALILALVLGVLYGIMHRSIEQLKAVQQLLHQFATIDALTGVFNRRQTMLRLHEEFIRLKRRSEPGKLTVMLLDIDHFKRINDTHGHAVGDSVLHETCQRLLRSLRAYDVLGRYGGEEFLIIAPDQSASQAHQMAERIRQSISAQPFQHAGLSIEVTISIGISEVRAEDTDEQAVVLRADQSMYQAKSEGRDRVIVSG